MADCLAEHTLSDLMEDRLSPEGRERVAEHIDRCPRCRTAVAALAVGWRPPDRVDEYRLGEPLGHGAAGDVYEAYDEQLERRVAVKFLRAEEPDATHRHRLLIEARAIARLRHPSVVAVYRVGEVDGRPYLVSELVAGRSLDHLERPVPARQARAWALALSGALGEAHRCGVLHRDIKPANVMIGDDGQVKLLDFGLAKLLDGSPGEAGEPGAAGEPGEVHAAARGAGPPPSVTRTGSLLGTPLYMAPELWRGEPATPRADVYALGALIYELCAGRPPHSAAHLGELRDLVLGGAPAPLRRAAPDVDAPLAGVVDRCLAPRTADRYTDGAALHAALEATPAEAPRAGTIARRVAAALALAFVSSLAPRTGAPPRPPRRIVAIIGLQNLSPRSDEAWLAGALGEGLARALSWDGDLRVLPAHRITEMKSDLALSEEERLGRDDLRRVRAYLGADWALTGAYAAEEEAGQRVLHVRYRVEDLAAGETLLERADRAPAGRISALATGISAALRRRLGLPPSAAPASAADAPPPPPERERLHEEAHVRGDAEASRRRHEALLARYPDDTDLRFCAIRQHLDAGRAREALAAIAEQRRAPPPDGDDPMLDLQEELAHRTLGDYEQAVRAAQQGARRAQLRGARSLVAAARMHEGWAHLNQGETSAALRAFSEALPVFEAKGHRVNVAWCLGGLAGAHQRIGAIRQAAAELDRALGGLRGPDGNQDVLAWTLLNSATTLLKLGDLSGARARAEEAAALARPGGGDALAMALVRGADVDLAAGRPAAARRALAEARGGGGQPLSLLPQLLISIGMARALLQAGDLPGSRAALSEALAARGGRRMLGKDLEQLRGALALAEGHPDEAAKHARAAIAEQQQELGHDEQGSRVLLVRALQAGGQEAEARRELDELTARVKGSEHLELRLGAALARLELSSTAAAPGRADAEPEAAAVRDEARRAGLLPLALEARLLLGRLHLRAAPARARGELRALAGEAETSGLGLLARRARTAAD